MRPISSNSNLVNQPINNIQTAFKKISTGLKINSAQDDAAGLTISNRLLAQINGLDRSIRNANDGISLAQVADAGLSGVQDAANRISELSIQAANGTLAATDRNAIQQEITQLQEQVGSISTSTQFGDLRVLNGGSIDIATGGNAVNLSLPDVAGSANTSGFESIDVSTAAGAQSAISTSAEFAKSIDSSRAQLGAFQSGLISDINTQSNTAINSQSSLSRIRDTDVAKEASEAAQEQMKLKAALALKAQAGADPNLLLALLKSS